jgi:hypothetical protein
MYREFIEETGYEIMSWKPLFVLHGPTWLVNFFYSVDDNAFRYAKSITDERVMAIKLADFNNYQHIPNLVWIIPMAQYFAKFPEETIISREIQSLTDWK